jgi:hypothetical protein
MAAAMMLFFLEEKASLLWMGCVIRNIVMKDGCVIQNKVKDGTV